MCIPGWLDLDRPVQEIEVVQRLDVLIEIVDQSEHPSGPTAGARRRIIPEQFAPEYQVTVGALAGQAGRLQEPADGRMAGSGRDRSLRVAQGSH